MRLCSASQSANAAPSSAHSKVASASSEVKAKVTPRSCELACGRSAIVVSGGVPSTIVHVCVTAGSSTMPKRLVAWIVNSCSPAASSS